MSDLAKELGAGSLTDDQVDAITHAWLDLCASKEHFESEEQFTGVGADELAVACTDSVEELEKEFPFLLEGVEDE
jgi:hypothetical protein